MDLVADDLIQPLGEIEPTLFPTGDPGGDTEARVTAWLGLAGPLVADLAAEDQNAAAAAYVYFRAFHAAYLRELARNRAEQVGKAQRERAADQAKGYLDLARRYEWEFRRARGDDPTRVVGTVTIPVEPVW